jgi:YVTN family beta-propeller protein
MGRKLALLVATSRYQDESFAALAAPEHDVAALADVLGNPDIAGFDVITLVNESRNTVGAAIGDFYRDCRGDDMTLIYFTGHGQKDSDGRLHIVLTDSRHDNLLFTALPAAQIDQAISECVSRRKILILDCCYSGAYASGYTPRANDSVHALEQFGGRGLTVLTASDSLGYSWEADSDSRESVFTRHLVEGIREGSADLNSDGDITLDELYLYIHDRVVEELPTQRPQLKDNIDGRTVVARNVRWTVPARVRAMLGSPLPDNKVAALDELVEIHTRGNQSVKAATLELIRGLTDDDSKAVSVAATARLTAITAVSALSPVAPPMPEPEPRPASMPQPEPRPAPKSRPAPTTVAGPVSVRWWRRRSTVTLATSVVAVVALGAVLVPRLLPRPAPPPPPPAAAPELKTAQNLPFGGIAESHDGRRAYVANFANDTVSVLDLTTNTLVGKPIPVGPRPQGVAVTADGRHVYVADSDASTVSIIDTQSLAVMGIAVARGPFGVASAPDRQDVYVTDFDAQTVSVLDADTETAAHPPIRVSGHPMGIAVHPQGHRIYVVDNTGTLSMIDTATFRVTTLPLGPVFAYGTALGPGGADLYVTTLRPNALIIIDTATQQPVGPPVAMPAGPYAVAAGTNGLVYVTNLDAGNLVAVDARTGTQVGAPIHVPVAPRGLIAVGQDRLYVTDGEGTVAIVDTQRGAVIGTPLALTG